MIELTLPYPVSANRYWRTVWPNGARCPVTTVSAQARAYRTQVRRLALEAGVVRPFSGRVVVSFVLFPRRPSDWKRRAKADPVRWDDSVQCIDLDNAQKILFDALEGVAFSDDAQVRHIAGRRAVPDGQARVEVCIAPLDETGHDGADRADVSDGTDGESAPLSDDSSVVERFPQNGGTMMPPVRDGADGKSVHLSDDSSAAERFPLNCRVRTPSGRLAQVRRHLSGTSKQDHFERVICVYMDGTRADDCVTLQPQFLTRLD